MKKEEKEKSRRSNRDSHSAPSSIQHRQAVQYRRRNHSKTEGSASYQLDQAMRYSDDYRVPVSCIEEGNRGKTNYNKAKSSKIPLHLPSHGGKTFVPGSRTKSFPVCLTKTTLEGGKTLVPGSRTKRVPTCLAKAALEKTLSIRQEKQKSMLFKILRYKRVGLLLFQSRRKINSG